MLANYFLYAPKIIFDFIFDIFYFLPWWYSRGWLNLAIKSWVFLIKKEEELAIYVWVKSILKPLYEQYSWQGIVKSVIMRIGQIILRSTILLFWVFWETIKMIAYLALPVLVVWEIVYQFI